jgi:hypothetical protein
MSAPLAVPSRARTLGCRPPQRASPRPRWRPSTGRVDRCHHGGVDPDDAVDVDAWFGARGYRVEVHDADALERTTTGNKPDRYTLALIGMRGQLHRPGYASGNLVEDV